MPKDIFLRQEFACSAERVFAALDDHANMGSWLGQKVSVAKRATDGGVGTVRRIHAGLTNIDEEIVERDPPSRLVYRIIAGMPGLSYHRGEVTVEGAGDQRSIVHWHVRVDSAIPGFAQLIAFAVAGALKKGLRNLARALS